MTKLRFLGLFAVILLLPFFSLGQFTRQQAKDLVLKQILASDTGHIKVYSSLDTIPDTSNIILSNGQTITPPYQSNWVFFSDDYPFATWFHPCRYVLVNSSNGDYTIDPAGIYPFDFQNAYGLILAPAILPPYVPPCQDIDPTYATPNPHLHAVLIAGATYIPISGNQQTNFDGDLSLIYNTLIERGYPPSNITVLDYNGDCNRIEWNGALAGGTNCVITGPAYRSWIDNVFSSFYPNNGSTTLYPDDQLFVYVTDHGTAVSTTNNGLISAMCIPSGPNYLDPTDYYTSNDMINAVRPIQCAQMIFLFQCCQAGTFQTLLNDGSALTQNRIVQTVAQLNEYAGEERTITGLPFGQICTEFTFYWSAAMRGYYPGSGGSNIGSVPWKWGCQVGSFPFIHYNWDSHVHPADDYNPDNGDPSAYDNPPPLGSVTAGNSDGYNQIIEAFNYANCMDSYSYYGFFGDVGHAVIETPQYGINNGFSITDPSKDDLFCLNGIAGNTLTGFSQTVDSRSYLLGGPVNVLSDMNILQSATLTMGVDNSIIDIKPNSQFSVQPNVTFIGTGQYSNTGLFIENTSNLLDLEHATFNSAFLQNYGQPLTIGNNSSFNDYSIVNSNRGNVTIKNSTFTNSLLYLEDQDQLSTNTAQITGCQFTFTDPTYTLNAAIIEDYQNFSITNNIIIGNVSQGNSVAYNGISLCYSGWGPLNHILQGNTISNCIVSGISIYGSQASLGNNNISNNQFGVEMLDNNSQTSLSGVPYRVSQEIYNCTENEIYATNNCFPNYMRCNEIYNENNTTNPFVYYDNKCHNYTPALDVMYNCWGDNIQDPSTVLYANCGNYLYNPTMCPQKNGGGSMSYSPDENMYNTAMSDDSIGDYSNAKSVFQLLIETYPESNFSRAAMKQLFAIEPYAGNNFSGLKTFYLSNDSIIADTTLAQLGKFLANKCDVQLQDWSNAISYYENKIQNSTDPADSVFAIIDLGHLYLTMDTTGQKSTIVGSLTQYKPKSRKKYVAYRDSLISLLPFHKDLLTKSVGKLQNGQLLQNVPNPSNASTDIYFKLFGATDASIRIYNSWGQLKQEIPLTDLADGTHMMSVNTSLFPAGVYEYSLSINERTTDTKKMVVIK